MPDAQHPAATRQAEERAAPNLRHDLRTLLNAILGYSGLWLEDLPADASPQTAETLAQIHRDGEFLLKQVNDLLDASRLLDAAYTAGLGERLRAELGARAEAVVAKSRALGATCSGPEELHADLHKIEAAGEKLLAMLASMENTIAGSAPATSISTPQITPPVQRGLRSRVLVVDDNEANRDVLSRRLLREGNVVDVAEHGAKALVMLEREPYNLVLLDIMMPEMNGYETLARIRADARWSDLPVIMISSVDEMDSVVRCIEMGAEDYLPKPFNPVLLRARVGACLEKKRLRDERAARQKVEQERLQWEIEMAARVQQKLLPARLPEIAGLDLAAGCVPARLVGGDYFDVLQLGECHVGLVVGDVEGKGMPAALVMATLVASLRSQAPQYADNVVQMAQSLNAQMHTWTEASKFVTMFYACFDLRNRRLRYVNAGHNLPLLVRAAERHVSEIPNPGGPVLGVLRDAPYEEGRIDLCSGDVLIVYTDGITEAFDPQEEEFGEERLSNAVLRSMDQSAAGIRETVISEVHAFSAGAPQADDMTLLVLKVA